jgi:TonB family protein
MSEGTLPPSRTNSIDERRAAQRRMLGGFMALSLGLHLGLAAGWLFFPDLTPRRPINLDDAIVKTKLVKLGKPRDDKLLPRIQASAPPPDASKKAPPTDAPTPDNPQKTAEKQPSAADILEQFKKDNAKKDVNDIIRDRLGEPDDQGQLDGDRDGVALEGEIKDAYFARVTAAIQRSHQVSTTISPEELVRLRAVVEFKIGEDGTISDVTIRDSSGNDVYDNGVIAAAKRASPVPAPPPPVRDLAARGVAVNVCPSKCS